MYAVADKLMSIFGFGRVHKKSRKKPVFLDEEEKEGVRKLYKDRVSNDDIKKRYNISTSYLYRIVNS